MEIPSNSSVTLTFDRRLAPSTLTRSNIFMTTGPFNVYAGFRYDVVRRRVEFVPNSRELRVGLQYVFTVRKGVLAWDGAPLSAELRFRFVPTAPVTVTPRTPPSFAREVAPLLRGRCARAECHGGPTPVMGLDLSSPRAIRETAVGVLSRERPSAREGSNETQDPNWGPLVRIDPGPTLGSGRPEYSYLVYKLLGDGPVIGQRMPPDGAALTDDEIARVADWIAAGAPDN